MEPKTISTAVHQKAQRLVDEGKVDHVKGLVYRVEGTTDTYTVHLSYPPEVSGACNCPSQAEVCSHLLAACIDYMADRNPILEAIGRDVEAWMASEPVQESGIE